MCCNKHLAPKGGPLHTMVGRASSWILIINPSRLGRSRVEPFCSWANKHSYWKLPFIVDFPMKNGDLPARSMLVCQRVHPQMSDCWTRIFVVKSPWNILITRGFWNIYPFSFPYEYPHYLVWFFHDSCSLQASTAASWSPSKWPQTTSLGTTWPYAKIHTRPMHHWTKEVPVQWEP